MKDWKAASELLLNTHVQTLRTWWQRNAANLLVDVGINTDNFRCYEASCKILLKEYGFRCYSLTRGPRRVLRFLNWPSC
jgi:hypothetical protein